MRRITTKAGVLAAVATLALASAPPADAEQATRGARHADDGSAYFEFADASEQTAVFKLTDPVAIKHARDLLSGATTDEPHVFGRIIKRSAPYNPSWDFHFDPATVRFFSLAIEVCDATIPYVNDHLDEAGGAFLPGLFWCPWTSRLVREVPAP